MPSPFAVADKVAGLQIDNSLPMKGTHIVGIDARDKGTPDDWVPRHPELIRLTGRHPFNCEPPVALLRQQGFITDTSLHYVRNHGAVPKTTWESHRVLVDGLVNSPTSFSMADITTKFDSIAFPATLMCVGNRRKEMNMVKQSIGFNWGSAALATNYWTGVRLSDVLQACGVKSRKQGARHVWFAGPPGELPKGDDGSYGTSFPLEYVMNEANDVILAYKQNAQLLHPDHGFPIRLIVPGYIGGRMIKWITHIHVSSEPSTNYYHYYDNKILPPHVDADLAMKEGWWLRQDYMLLEYNIQSTIWTPNHNDVLPLNGSTPATYTIKGYALSGGGRPITRVEVSFDNAESWLLGKITHPGYQNDYEKLWTWVFWELEVPVTKLLGSAEMMCRAWDLSTNTQPDKLTWSLMGQGNNCCFRVKIWPTQLADGTFALAFEHPTQAGSTPGGWMTRPNGSTQPPPELMRPVAFSTTTTTTTTTTSQNQNGLQNGVQIHITSAPAASPTPSPAAVPSVPPQPNLLRPSGFVSSQIAGTTSGVPTLTMDEVARHDKESDCWIVVKGNVYDCTPFLSEHPGGAQSIVINAGTDSTEDFEAVHSSRAWEMLDKYLVGPLGGPMPSKYLEGTTIPPPTEPTPSNSNSNRDANSHLNLNSNLNSNSNPSVDPAQQARTPPATTTTTSLEVTLKPKTKVALHLQEKLALSHDVVRLRFALPTPDHILGLPNGQHVLLSATVGGKPVMRAYTPTTADDVRGHVDFVIKVYKPNVHPKFPAGGVFSQHLGSLEVGQTVDFKGPIGHVVYKGRGLFVLDGKVERVAREVGMICGGSGITPMFQVAKAMLADPEDHTRIHLLYANQTEADILLRPDLDRLCKEYPERFQVWYTLDRPPQDWAYSSGFICQDMLEAHMPRSGAEGGSMVLMCGPPPMINFACVPNLQKLGFTEQQYLAF
eukprot:CAMPEP_0196653062 /NCGR_PEP_ID=MMETSP1086-20130531/2635_1 /TAXON_ID=77921 /ORGANISM="Cyanoptyche  gloeocystis , Strain SAG4.97" /LENGTH=940 /DNA_ID=CAMNT_0041984043 /DNA_START=132 /DNA_END=2954 /DNA_ORIENTATION=+